MSKIIFIVLIAAVACWFGFHRSSGEKVKFPQAVISKKTGVKTVEADDRIRVLLFTGTEWCPACQHLDSTVIATKEWKEFAGGEIRFRAFDFPSDRSRVPEAVADMAKNYEVRAYPTMLVLGPNNEELSRQEGAGAPVENYKAWIRRHAKFYERPKEQKGEEGEVAEKFASTAAAEEKTDGE